MKILKSIPSIPGLFLILQYSPDGRMDKLEFQDKKLG